ncbi:MAG: nicotinate-nucleotide adenylyltransferase [Clostridiales bacterium]|jgi:nicotinate-nucleotide adenylyltransferase|nr:nicotinate-nucleotide adenylyltransferase [Clostridiales bacterium]
MTDLKGLRRVALMGGAFNPIHNGHLAAAEETARLFSIDRVIFVPAGDPPHKSGFGMAPAADRYDMVSAAVADNPFFTASRIEIDRPGPSYSADTVRETRAAMDDGAELFFIIGADAAELLPEWRDAGRIFELCRFISVTRPGYVLTQPFGEDPGRQLLLCPLTPVSLSSTEIRAMIHLGRRVRYLIPDAVLRIIEDRGLYRSDEGFDWAASEKLRQTLKPSRYRHTMAVAREAERLAGIFGADARKARVASLLHDNAKTLGEDETRNLLAYSADGAALGETRRKYPKVFHAFIGAESARRDFGVTDPEILGAVRYHTTGRPDMPLLETVVYLADAIEETREDYPALSEIRRRVDASDLTGAMLASLLDTAGRFTPEALHPLTAAAIEYYNKKTERESRMEYDAMTKTWDKSAALAGAKAAVAAIEEKMGKDAAVLDISDISVMADYFVIATAGSAAQLKALADEIDKQMFGTGFRLRHQEGVSSSGWILLDFGSVVVHLFTKEQRGFYDLERIWGDAERILENGEWKIE